MPVNVSKSVSTLLNLLGRGSKADPYRLLPMALKGVRYGGGPVAAKSPSVLGKLLGGRGKQTLAGTAAGGLYGGWTTFGNTPGFYDPSPSGEKQTDLDTESVLRGLKNVPYGVLAGMAAGAPMGRFSHRMKWPFVNKMESPTAKLMARSMLYGAGSGLALASAAPVFRYTGPGRVLMNVARAPGRFSGAIDKAEQKGREFLMGSEEKGTEGLSTSLQKTIGDPLGKGVAALQALVGTTKGHPSPVGPVLGGAGLGSVAGLLTSLISSSRSKEKDEEQKGWIARNPTATALLGGLLGGIGGIGYHKLRGIGGK